MKHYAGTTVHWSRSQGKIVKELIKRKIFDTQFTNMKDSFILQFKIPHPSLKEKLIGVRIIVPIKVDIANENKKERELNRLHRVLYHHIKAKFSAVESGLTEIMEEFMPHIVIFDNNGNSSTMGRVLLPQYTKNLEIGNQCEFKLLGDSKI